MFWFVVYRNSEANEVIRRFSNIDKMWDFLQEIRNTEGALPNAMLVFKAECVFDGS